MRALIIMPVTLFAVAVIYMVANPSGQSIGQGAVTPTENATIEPAETPTLAALPSGLSGQLSYRSEGEQITVQFPSGDEVERAPSMPGDVRRPSADGLWRMNQQCGDLSCKVSLFDEDGAETTIELTSLIDVQWSSKGHTLAFAGSMDTPPFAHHLYIVEDPAAPAPRRIDRNGVTSFTWLEDGRLLFVAPDGEVSRASLSGGEESLAHLAPVSYLHVSPDGHRVAFTQNNAQGWHLWTIDGYDGTLRDLGNMGSDPAGTTPPVEVAPEQKGPMYIGWSPDGSYLAFGGGFEPPYMMTTINVTNGASVRTEFPYGYPGEMKWSPDGTKLAVSSYDVERTRHESYVVDPATGVATHLLSGCVIVWSYDSRFLAVHGEPDPGISIVDVMTGEQAKISRGRNDIPLTWKESAN